MPAIEFVERNPDFSDLAPDYLDIWGKVYEQAINHTHRGEVGDLFKKARPNENEVVQEYRETNYRMLTKEGVDKFLVKSARIFQNSGASLAKETISETLKEWLAEKPFEVAGQNMGLFEFFQTFVLFKAIEDPNSLLFAFPQHSDPLTAPALPVIDGGHPPNEQIPIVPLHVNHDKIKYIDEDIIVWLGGLKVIENGDYAFYYIADAEGYYLYEPFREGKKIVYILSLWYRHDKGSLPVNWLPGRFASDGGYRESFLHHYFEYADEFVSRFSDGQAVWVQHAYPKPIIAEMPCRVCDGSRKIKKPGKDGGTEMHPCNACGGTGKITNIGPHDVLIRPEDSSDVGRVTVKPIYELVSPPPHTLELTYDKPFDLFKRAKQSIGLDLLENLEESGTAKEHRLEDLQDYLSSIGSSLFDCAARFLWDVEVLLQPQPTLRSRPVINKPLSYSIKSVQMLKDEAEEALPADRINAQIKYYKTKYTNDKVLQKVYEFALFYSPLLVMTDDEIKTRIASGIYSNNDLIKRDYAIQAFMDLKDTDGFMEWDKKRAKQEADDYIESLGVLELIPVINEGGADMNEAEREAQAKLKGTVGGVTGIIEMNQAVATGVMSEAAAESILQEIYGIRPELAKKLIEPSKSAAQIEEAASELGI